MIDMGRFEEAAKYLLVALKIYPDPEIYEKFLEAVRQIGDEDTADKYYSAVSDYYPDDGDLP